MKQIRELGVFVGEPGQQVFSYDLSLLRERKYFLAGQMIAWSIIHGGPGVSSLSPTVFALMLSSEATINNNTDVKLICDLTVRKLLMRWRVHV